MKICNRHVLYLQSFYSERSHAVEIASKVCLFVFSPYTIPCTLKDPFVASAKKSIFTTVIQ